MLLCVMFASLVMSTSAGEAFGDRAWLFVAGYLAIQIGRTGPGRPSRLVGVGNYTLIAMVIGIIAIAVGDELAIAHPHDPTTLAISVLVFGGPAIFLLAQLGFMRAASGCLSRSRLIACVSLLALGVATAPLSLLAAVIAATAVLVAVAREEPEPASA